MNGDAELVSGPVDFDRADAGRFQAAAQRLLQLQVLPQKLGVILLGEPPRPPCLGDAQPESVRMYFLPHANPFLRTPVFGRPSRRCAPCAADSGKRAPWAPAAPFSCAAPHSRKLP